PKRSSPESPSAAPSGAAGHDRQAQLEDGPARLARELDEAAVAAHEILRDREPQTRARGPPRDERIEDRVLELLRNAGAVVLDLGRQDEPMLLGADREVRQRARAENQPPALADGLQRIARE